MILEACAASHRQYLLLIRPCPAQLRSPHTPRTLCSLAHFAIGLPMAQSPSLELIVPPSPCIPSIPVCMPTEQRKHIHRAPHRPRKDSNHHEEANPARYVPARSHSSAVTRYQRRDNDGGASDRRKGKRSTWADVDSAVEARRVGRRAVNVAFFIEHTARQAGRLDVGMFLLRRVSHASARRRGRDGRSAELTIPAIAQHAQQYERSALESLVEPVLRFWSAVSSPDTCDWGMRAQTLDCGRGGVALPRPLSKFMLSPNLLPPSRHPVPCGSLVTLRPADALRSSG